MPTADELTANGDTQDFADALDGHAAASVAVATVAGADSPKDLRGRGRDKSRSPYRAPEVPQTVIASDLPLDVLRSMLVQQQATLNLLTTMVAEKCAPPGLSLEQPPNATTMASLSSHEAMPSAQATMKSIPDDVITKIEKQTVLFQKLVVRRLRSQESIETKKISVDVLKPGMGAYPAYVRPFKSPIEFDQLDECMSQATVDEVTLAVVIPKNSSRRVAMEIFYRAQVRFHCMMELEAHEEQYRDLVARTSKQALIDIIMSLTPSYPPSLGLEEPDRKELPKDLMLAKAHKSYQHVVDKITAMKQTAKDAKDNEEKRKKKEGHELLQQKPETLLTSVIESKAAEAASRALQALVTTTSADASMGTEQIQPPASVTQFVQAINVPKNGPSPGKGLGHNSRNDGNTTAPKVQQKGGSPDKQSKGGKTKTKPKYWGLGRVLVERVAGRNLGLFQTRAKARAKAKTRTKTKAKRRARARANRKQSTTQVLGVEAKAKMHGSSGCQGEEICNMVLGSYQWHDPRRRIDPHEFAQTPLAKV
jgi:hypothetical protein